MRYVRTVAPASPVIALDEAKLHLRVTGSAEDALITALCLAAEQYLDARTGILGRALVTQTWRLESPGPCRGRIRIDLPPVTCITGVRYYSDGSLVTWLSEQRRLGYDEIGAFVVPEEGISWPTADCREDAWQITFKAGDAAPGDVPAPIRAALLLLIGHLYKNREASLESAFADLKLAMNMLIGGFCTIQL